MNITYCDFEKHLNKVKKLMEFQDKMRVLCSEAYKQDIDCEFTFPTLIDDVVELLANITGDSSEWIDYFLFELDCGKKYRDGMIIDKDGKVIKLRTIMDLWNIISKENLKNKTDTY